MRTLVLPLLVALVGCGADLPPPNAGAAPYPLMDPADPQSIAAWEESAYNFGDFQVEVVKLRHFQPVLGDSAPHEPQPMLVHVYGAKSSGITPAQQASIDFLVEHEAELHAAVREAVYQQYRESYPAYKQGLSIGAALYGGSSEEIAALLPEIKTGHELDQLVKLGSIYVHPGQQGVAPIGIEFAVPFDEEHGIGLRLVGKEVSDIGTAHEAYARPQARPPAHQD